MPSNEELMDEDRYAPDESQAAAEDAVPEIDLDRAGMLLELIAKCVNIGPSMSYIQGEAGEELKHINEACRKRALTRADAIRRRETDALTAQQRELKASNEQSFETDEGVVEPNDSVAVDRRGA